MAGLVITREFKSWSGPDTPGTALKVISPTLEIYEFAKQYQSVHIRYVHSHLIYLTFYSVDELTIFKIQFSEYLQ